MHVPRWRGDHRGRSGLMLSRTGSGVVWVVVLAVPAFLAAATVTRLLGIARTLHLQHRVRVIRWARRCRR